MARRAQAKRGRAKRVAYAKAKRKLHIAIYASTLLNFLNFFLTFVNLKGVFCNIYFFDIKLLFMRDIFFFSARFRGVVRMYVQPLSISSLAIITCYSNLGITLTDKLTALS